MLKAYKLLICFFLYLYLALYIPLPTKNTVKIGHVYNLTKQMLFEKEYLIMWIIFDIRGVRQR